MVFQRAVDSCKYHAPVALDRAIMIKFSCRFSTDLCSVTVQPSNGRSMDSTAVSQHSETSNKCIASSNKCLTSSNKKLLGTKCIATRNKCLTY